MSGLADRPRLDLGSFPTAVEAAPELGDALGVPNLHLKREDRSGEPYGGNKVRKLEFLLGRAVESGCSGVVTGGGIGSNHVLATAAYAREVGLEPRAVQFPQPVTGHVRENLRALAALEPELHLARSRLTFPVSLLRHRVAAHRSAALGYVPLGGSSPVGTLGFVAAGRELARQVDRGDCPRPDLVVVPASSGGTLAGLVVGLDRAGLDTRVVGVRVTGRYAANRLRIARLATRTAELLDDPVSYTPGDIALTGGYLGPGYGEPTPLGRRVSKVAAAHGLTLDPTYTAKTVGAIAAEFTDETVLYWHTLSERRPEMLSTGATLDRLPGEYRQFFP
jgi:1-aminocyclopropane-1-carboxylate deaminase/D-cysteine desulfhydrase-like pyridoxal-dependent ACC family enzyme